MNINYQNIPIIYDIPPNRLFIPIAAATFCYLLPLAIDRIFPYSLSASAPLHRLRGRIRYEVIENFYRRFPLPSYVIRVPIRDNLYITIFFLSIIQLKNKNLFQPFVSDGRVGLIILTSCIFLHFTRLYMTKTALFIAQKYFIPQTAEKIDQIVHHLAPTQIPTTFG